MKPKLHTDLRSKLEKIIEHTGLYCHSSLTDGCYCDREETITKLLSLIKMERREAFKEAFINVKSMRIKSHAKTCLYFQRRHSHDCDCGLEDYNITINDVLVYLDSKQK